MGQEMGRLRSTAVQLGLMYWAATLPPLVTEPTEGELSGSYGVDSSGVSVEEELAGPNDAR